MVVEADAGSQAQEALQNALAKAEKGAGPMSLQGEYVLAGPEDGFDPLVQGSQMGTLLGLVLAPRTHHGGLSVRHCLGELPAGIAFVGQQGLSSGAPAALKEFQSHLAFVSLRRGQGEGPGSAVGGKDGVQAHSPELAGVAGTVPVVTDVGKGRAKDGLPASCTLDRSGVDEQEVICEARALFGKDEKEPLKHGGQASPALEVASLSRKLREQTTEVPAGESQKPAIRGDTHNGLGHTQGDDLRIGRPAASISPLLWQKIIGCAINDGAESVEVGVHRGLQADGVLDTADFGLSASNPSLTGMLVESII